MLALSHFCDIYIIEICYKVLIPLLPPVLRIASQALIGIRVELIQEVYYLKSFKSFDGCYTSHQTQLINNIKIQSWPIYSLFRTQSPVVLQYLCQINLVTRRLIRPPWKYKRDSEVSKNHVYYGHRMILIAMIQEAYFQIQTQIHFVQQNNINSKERYNKYNIMLGRKRKQEVRLVDQGTIYKQGSKLDVQCRIQNNVMRVRDRAGQDRTFSSYTQ